MPGRLFIESSDFAAFAQDRVRFGRQVRELVDTGRSSPPQPLEDVVARRLMDKGFRCLGVEVVGDDGMSWTAHVADTVIEEKRPQAARLRLRGGLGSDLHPEIEQLIPPRKIAAIAQRNGLVKSAKLLGRRRYAVTVAGAITLGTAGSVLGVTFTGHGFSLTALTLPLVIVLVVVASLAVCGQLLIETLRSDSDSSPFARAAEDIAAEAKREHLSEGFRDFIYGLAAELSRPSQYRCLIVDDFTSLDLITRMVLQYYLQYFADIGHPELWILFYSSDDKWLKRMAVEKEKGEHAPYGFRRIVIYLLAHLSTAKGKELADVRGVPWQGYHTVGAIIRGDGKTALHNFFQQEYSQRAELVEGEQVGDLLIFFYILALNAVPRHNRWVFGSEIRANFSGRNRRSRLLDSLMGGRHLTSAETGKYLRLISERFFPQAGTMAGDNKSGASIGRFLIAPEASACLESSWSDFGLPNPSSVHLFWALYWADRELHGTTNIAVLPLVCAHLLKSATPASIKNLLADTQAEIDMFTDELYNTVLELVKACLKLCLLDNVAGLLNHALILAEDDRQQVERRRRARLRPLAWQAYSLLGDEKLFSIILELQQAAPVQRADDGPPKYDLTYLYLQSIPGEEAHTRALIRGELSRSGAAPHSGGYARARAAWLMTSIAPFLSPGMRSLAAVAKDAQARMPSVVATSITALESLADGEWHTTDVLDVLIGLWALALVTDVDRAPKAGWRVTPARAAEYVDLLSQTYLLGADLAKQRQSLDSSPETLDFVLDCLVQELLAVALAAGVLMLLRWPTTIWREDIVRDDVVEVVRESARLLGMNEHVLTPPGGTPDRDLIAELGKHMSLLTVLWRALSFDQQASFMAIRLGQFRAVLTNHDAQLAESAMELLATEMKQADHVGLLANLTTAESAKVSEQLEAEWLTRASKAAIKGRFGDRLAAELCIASIVAGHTYAIDYSECLDFMLEPWVDESTPRLGTLLSEISDDDMTEFTRAILNIVPIDPTGRADRVLELLDSRIDAVEDPAVKKSVSGLYRIFVLRRHIVAKQGVDVNRELDEWQPLKDLSEYGFVLYLLFTVAPRNVHDRLVIESVAILENFNVYLQNTGYVLLADTLVRAAGPSSEAGEVGLRALARGFDVHERYLSVDTNIRVLTILKQRDARKYQPKFFEWQKIMLEVDETKRLPELVDQGRYFLLIWHYFQLFVDYQLQSEPPVSQYGFDDTEKTQALRDWQANSRMVPDPVIRGRAGARLSGDFLRLGYALFYAPAMKGSGRSLTEAEIEDGRQQCDHKARAVITDLYQMLERLPAIPKSVEQIVRRHEALVRSMIVNQSIGD